MDLKKKKKTMPQMAIEFKTGYAYASYADAFPTDIQPPLPTIATTPTLAYPPPAVASLPRVMLAQCDLCDKAPRQQTSPPSSVCAH